MSGLLALGCDANQLGGPSPVLGGYARTDGVQHGVQLGVLVVVHHGIVVGALQHALKRSLAAAQHAIADLWDAVGGNFKGRFDGRRLEFGLAGGASRRADVFGAWCAEHGEGPIVFGARHAVS